MTEAPEPSAVPVWMTQAVPALLVAAVVGLAGLFVQVARIDEGLQTVASDISELKNDSRERLSGLEARVRHLEMRLK